MTYMRLKHTYVRKTYVCFINVYMSFYECLKGRVQQHSEYTQRSAKRWSPGLENFVSAYTVPHLPGLACTIHATWGPPFSQALICILVVMSSLRLVRQSQFHKIPGKGESANRKGILLMCDWTERALRISLRIILILFDFISLHVTFHFICCQ